MAVLQSAAVAMTSSEALEIDMYHLLPQTSELQSCTEDPIYWILSVVLDSN